MNEFANIYFSMTSRLREITKGVICVLLLCSSGKVSNALVVGIEKRYGAHHIDYFMRIMIIISFVALLVLGVKMLSSYIRKNTESLVLLGLSDKKILLLFFIKHYELLFAVLYIGILVGCFLKMNIVAMILIHGLHAIVVSGLIVGLYVLSRYSWSRWLLYVLVVIGAILFALGMVNYENAYKFLMSGFADVLFDKIYLYDVLSKGLLLVLSLVVSWHEIKKNGLMVETDKKKQISDSRFGDYWHNMGKRFSFRKEYLWIYRDKDFLVWKIFATVIYTFICAQTDDMLELIICGYVISLITTSYLLNIYQMDRKHLITYYLSDYSFCDLLKDHVKSGIAIMGDTLLAISLFFCLRSIRYFVVLMVLVFIMYWISGYMYTMLYAKYNRRVYWLDYIVILIGMHIPIWNIRSWYVNYNRGNENWSKLSYERQ